MFSKSAMTSFSIGTQTEPIDTQQLSKIHHSVPDPEEGRYCKPCKAWLPVQNFPSEKRRYCCKLHRWERFGKLEQHKHIANAGKKLLFGFRIKVYAARLVLSRSEEPQQPSLSSQQPFLPRDPSQSSTLRFVQETQEECRALQLKGETATLTL